jgi:hypothetical protein
MNLNEWRKMTLIPMLNVQKESVAKFLYCSKRTSEREKDSQTERGERTEEREAEAGVGAGVGNTVVGTGVGAGVGGFTAKEGETNDHALS